MLPHEAQALMAKVMFFFFAVSLLLLGKVRAQEVQAPTSKIAISKNHNY
tara:strand:+ start:194659 stop:194805 length:147 start_codon:yes stop_codon:yes gene_type:complete